MRPDVRIIQNSEVSDDKIISGSEANDLLSKYGYSSQYNGISNIANDPKNDLSFEEMIKMEQDKEASILNKIESPKPITFNSQYGYDSEIKYASDSDGFGFRIEISSDMKLPRY